MTRPLSVTDPAYWKDQLERAGEHRLHLATWWAPRRWMRHHDRRHARVLEKFVGPGDSVLDCGCAYGRLLGVMPPAWRGNYLGVDVSPDFIELGRRLHPGREFMVADLRDLGGVTGRFDWAVLVGVKYTLIGGAGAAAWERAESEVRRVADRLLFLEWAVDEEPDYGVEKVCHHEYERCLTEAERAAADA